ncbi:MAG: hypothetical protein FJY99_04760 [Candidatus Sericytochromatia bacterium]|nr:hypothetical protein [Candidatus Tanganyikabacteria bacterium]
MFGLDAPLALAPLSTLAPTLDHPAAEGMPAGIHEMAVVSEPAGAPGLGRRLLSWRTGLDGGVEVTAGLRLPDGLETTVPMAGLQLGGGYSVIPGLYRVYGDVVVGGEMRPEGQDWRIWQVLELVTPWGTPRLAQGWLAGRVRVLAAYDATVLPGVVLSGNTAWQGDAGFSAALGSRWRFAGDLALVAGLLVNQERQLSATAGLGCRL